MVTEQQFNALAELARVGRRDKDGRSLAAARSMMLDGMTPGRAAVVHGISQPTARETYLKLLEAQRLARIVCGLPSEE